MNQQFEISWHDAGTEPRHPANPAYPNGVDLIAATPGVAQCKAALPYPARRIGTYLVECHRCGLRVVVSTAGRRDDPKSITVACKVAVRH